MGGDRRDGHPAGHSDRRLVGRKADRRAAGADAVRPRPVAADRRRRGLHRTMAARLAAGGAVFAALVVLAVPLRRPAEQPTSPERATGAAGFPRQPALLQRPHGRAGSRASPRSTPTCWRSPSTLTARRRVVRQPARRALSLPHRAARADRRRLGDLEPLPARADHRAPGPLPDRPPQSSMSPAVSTLYVVHPPNPLDRPRRLARLSSPAWPTLAAGGPPADDRRRRPQRHVLAPAVPAAARRRLARRPPASPAVASRARGRADKSWLPPFIRLDHALVVGSLVRRSASTTSTSPAATTTGSSSRVSVRLVGGGKREQGVLDDLGQRRVDPVLLRRHVVGGLTERHRLDQRLDDRRRLRADHVGAESSPVRRIGEHLDEAGRVLARPARRRCRSSRSGPPRSRGRDPAPATRSARRRRSAGG